MSTASRFNLVHANNNISDVNNVNTRVVRVIECQCMSGSGSLLFGKGKEGSNSFDPAVDF